MLFCRWTAWNSEFRIALSKSFRPRVHRWGSAAAMPGRRIAFIRRILNYTVHRVSRAHRRSPALSNIFPGVHLQRILHRTGRKTTVATTRDSKLSLVSVDELIFSGRFLCLFVLYPRAYFHPSLHVISLPSIFHRFSFLPMFLDLDFVSDL